MQGNSDTESGEDGNHHDCGTDLDQLIGLVVEKHQNTTLTERHHHLVGHSDTYLRHVMQTAGMQPNVEFSSNLNYMRAESDPTRGLCQVGAHGLAVHGHDERRREPPRSGSSVRCSLGPTRDFALWRFTQLTTDRKIYPDRERVSGTVVRSTELRIICKDGGVVSM